MRGEYHGRHGNHQHAWELPPRARRIHGRQGFTRIKHGTTSACAENTKSERMSDAPPRNYLRVRGEYSGIRQWACTQAELPPRARRILIHGFRVVTDSGTTSACAENTVVLQDADTGESELPPRARRIHLINNQLRLFHGTTSACAENTGQTP